MADADAYVAGETCALPENDDGDGDVLSVTSASVSVSAPDYD
jgi:hypothetical protein